MKSKKIVIFLTSIIMAISSICTSLILRSDFESISATDIQYKLVINQRKNDLTTMLGSGDYNGEFVVKTDLNNDIAFECSNFKPNYYCATVKSGGYFCNKTPIHGIESIKISSTSVRFQYMLYWSYLPSFDECESKSFATSGSPRTFDFNGAQPSYLKFENVSENNIPLDYIEITFSCATTHPVLSLSSNDNIKGTVTGPSGAVELGDNVTIMATPNEGCSFVGWYRGDTLISNDSVYSFVMQSEDLNFTAYFANDLYNFSVLTESSLKGTVTDVSGSYIYQDSITVQATPTNGYVFYGWYDGLNRVSSANPYTFTMPLCDYSLVAKFLTLEESELHKKYAVDPIISSDRETLIYGLYPQKNISDPSVINSLNALSETEPNGWYSYEGDYYAKTIAKPYHDAYKFDNGVSIVRGETYWFKCEPISWKILKVRNQEYTLISSLLLDVKVFFKYRSTTLRNLNYMESDIRNFLNSDFLYSAFALGDSYIQTTTVDNSPSTTDTWDNSYCCENTYDKVFLLSYRDYQSYNNPYGFYDNLAGRCCAMTDWVKARGANATTVSEYQSDDGFYWTRSLSNHGSAFVVFYKDGFVNADRQTNFYDEKGCVRPSISLKIV